MYGEFFLVVLMCTIPSIVSFPQVIAKCLALRTNLMDFQGNIVVSVNDDKDAAIIKDILKATKARSVTTLNTEQLQGRFLAQVVLQPGLFDIVYAMTNGQPSATFYTLPPTLIPSKWVGKSFQDIEKLNSDGSNILVGYTDEQGEVHLAAHDDYTITSKSSLVFFGLPNSPTKVPLTARVDLPYTKARSYDKPQNVLICGWRHNVAEMLKELGESLPKKSKLIVLADSELPTLPRKLAKSSVHVIQGKWDDYQNLVKAFEVANIDKVVVLASSSPSESDDKVSYFPLVQVRKPEIKQLKKESITSNLSLLSGFGSDRRLKVFGWLDLHPEAHQRSTDA